RWEAGSARGDSEQIEQVANPGEVTTRRQTQHAAGGQEQFDGSGRLRSHTDGKEARSGQAVAQAPPPGIEAGWRDAFALTEGRDAQTAAREALQTLVPKVMSGRIRSAWHGRVSRCLGRPSRLPKVSR